MVAAVLTLSIMPVGAAFAAVPDGHDDQGNHGHCAEGTVPGWLDESGHATSCVDNHAVSPVKPEPGDTALVMPGIPGAVVPFMPSPTPAPDPAPIVPLVIVPPVVPQLADTGQTGILPLAGLAALLLTAGGVMWRFRRKSISTP